MKMDWATVEVIDFLSEMIGVTPDDLAEQLTTSPVTGYSGYSEGTTIQGLVGQRVKSYRESEGMSQYSLAKAAGISRASVAKIEVGEMNASLEILTKIARAMDTRPWRFFRNA